MPGVTGSTSIESVKSSRGDAAGYEPEDDDDLDDIFDQAPAVAEPEAASRDDDDDDDQRREDSRTNQRTPSPSPSPSQRSHVASGSVRRAPRAQPASQGAPPAVQHELSKTYGSLLCPQERLGGGGLLVIPKWYRKGTDLKEGNIYFASDLIIRQRGVHRHVWVGHEVLSCHPLINGVTMGEEVGAHGPQARWSSMSIRALSVDISHGLKDELESAFYRSDTMDKGRLSEKGITSEIRRIMIEQSKHVSMHKASEKAELGGRNRGTGVLVRWTWRENHEVGNHDLDKTGDISSKTLSMSVNYKCV
ncbi:hypothetical protein C8R47DRAFT_1197522 [Mycena vitilis]|nr:hypothetical protein C8R47DRAFT_1197522 [Mycena vitilis]